MAQNLIIANAQYSDVPSISIPTQGGGSASFIDTSDGTVVAEDVLADKVCYSQGVRIVGTGTGGSATKYGISIDNLLGEVNASGQLQFPTGGDVDLVVSGFTSINSYVFNYKFSRNNALKTVVFTDLQEANGASSFASAFNNCTNLQSVSFPKLVSANGSSVFSYAFGGCTVLESVSFPSLRVIGNANDGTSKNNQQFHYAFQACNKLTEVRFPALEEIYCNGTNNSYGTFCYNAKLTKMYFPSLHTITKTAKYSNETASRNIFSNCTALTEIHFGAENQSAIESTKGYATKWGAPRSCQILFDL